MLFSWYPQPNQNKPVLINRRFRRDPDPIISTQQTLCVFILCIVYHRTEIASFLWFNGCTLLHLWCVCKVKLIRDQTRCRKMEVVLYSEKKRSMIYRNKTALHSWELLPVRLKWLHRRLSHHINYGHFPLTSDNQMLFVFILNSI